MEIKDILNVTKQNYTYNFSYFSQCIALKPESNFPKIPAFCESAKHYCRLHSVHDTMQCTQSVHRFRGQSTGYHNGCFSAVNRVKHLYSHNCHLKCHGNSIEQVWLKLNICPPVALILTGTMFSFDLALPALFGWDFPGSITSGWRMSPLGDVVHAKLTSKQMKMSVSI